MIFARSRRSMFLFAAAGLAVALAFGATAVVSLIDGRPIPVQLILTLVSIAGLGITGWAGARIRRWPIGRLAFFRDRLVVVQGRTELRAQWDRIEVATLTAPQDWTSGRWPELNLTDRLTVQLRNERPLQFQPAAFGLEPVGCRDLILRLRDNPGLRDRLPEFDSALDLAIRPVVSGELIKPRI
jgi:hypothetical protein